MRNSLLVFQSFFTILGYVKDKTFMYYQDIAIKREVTCCAKSTTQL